MVRLGEERTMLVLVVAVAEGGAHLNLLSQTTQSTVPIIRHRLSSAHPNAGR